MKKAFLIGISATFILMVFSACGSQSQESPIRSSHSNKEVEADTLSTEQEPVQEELSGDKLTALFEEVYAAVRDTLGTDTPDEEKINWEIKSLSLFIGDNQKLPEDYEALYKEWRAANITEDEEQAQSAPQDLEELANTTPTDEVKEEIAEELEDSESWEYEEDDGEGLDPSLSPDFSDLGDKPDYTGKNGTEGCIDTTGYTSGANDPDYELPDGFGFGG